MSLERNSRDPGHDVETPPPREVSSRLRESPRTRDTLSRAGGVTLRQPRPRLAKDIRGLNHDRFFLAEQRSDGTYGVTFTEQGIKTFETALGIAHDLGGDSLISPYSSIADVMERTATREAVSDVLRSELRGFLRLFRLTVLRRKLRGSERPTVRQAIVGHIGKLIIVLLFVFWTMQQFITAVQDITAIPNILSNVPVDLLQPTAPFGHVTSNVSDAGHHFLLGIVGIHLAYIIGALIRPLARIYRKDAIIPGERLALRLTNHVLTRIAPAQHP